MVLIVFVLVLIRVCLKVGVCMIMVINMLLICVFILNKGLLVMIFCFIRFFFVDLIRLKLLIVFIVIFLGIGKVVVNDVNFLYVVCLFDVVCFIIF